MTGRCRRAAASRPPLNGGALVGGMQLDPTRAVSAFKELEGAVRDVLLEHDPSGLFAMGAPRGEHDSDIHRVISKLQFVDKCEGVSDVLQSVLGGWISESGHEPARICAAMAPDLWRAWLVYQEKAG